MHSDAQAIVAVFSDSLMLRETLAVLLERECHLEFLSQGTTGAVGALSPDLAVLAMPTPDPVLRDLAREWPGLPIVAIDPTQIGGRETAALSPPGSGVKTVALEPQAIRTAVISRLPTTHPFDRRLRAMVSQIGETLRADLQYSFTMLRSFPALYARGAGHHADPILAAILGEQASVIGEHVEQLERFRTRPRTGQLAEDFVEELCRQLEHADAETSQRGLLCACSLDTASPTPPGPVALAPLVAALVQAHLRRRSEPAVINVRAAANRVSMRYTPRSAAHAKTTSWPLLLANLVLETWSWRISTSVSEGEEILTLLGTV